MRNCGTAKLKNIREQVMVVEKDKRIILITKSTPESTIECSKLVQFDTKTQKHTWQDGHNS